LSSADVGDEVATHLLDARRLGVVLDQQQDVASAERCHPGLHDRVALAERPLGQREPGLADHAVAPHLPGEVAQLIVDELLTAHEAVGHGRRGVVDDLVGRVDHDAARAQDRQHVTHPGRQGRRPGCFGHGRLLALGVAHGDHGKGPGEQSGEPRQDRRARRVHASKIRGADRSPGRREVLPRQRPQLFT